MKTTSTSGCTLLTLVALVCGLWLTVSCRQQATEPAAACLDPGVIASVQGFLISGESYRQKLGDRIGRSDAPLSGATKQAVLEDMIRHEAVYARAKAAKFEEQPELARLIRNLIVTRFIEHELPAGEPSITTEAVQEYYNSHGAEFVAPPAVRAALIFLRAGARMTPEKREELRQQARRILTEAAALDAEADFARLVQRHSDHQPSRYRAGDLGWMTREQCESALGAEVSAALFKLPTPGGFAPLLETPAGFYILKMRQRREAQLRPLSEVDELIRYQLSRQHRARREAEFYARMKQGLDIQINQSLLESISIPPPADPPPALPGSTTAPRVVTR